MKTWLALVPFAAFAAAFCVGAIALWFIGKQTKISQTETQYGKALHVESPIGMLDVHPESKLDARLAQIPSYPGAMPENPLSAESVSQIHFGNKSLQEISASYWTPDNLDQVWDFYREQLPDWPRNLDEAQGKEIIHHEQDCVRLVRITRRGERTVIETCLKPPGYPHLFSGRGYQSRGV